MTAMHRNFSVYYAPTDLSDVDVTFLETVLDDQGGGIVVPLNQPPLNAVTPIDSQNMTTNVPKPTAPKTVVNKLNAALAKDDADELRKTVVEIRDQLSPAQPLGKKKAKKLLNEALSSVDEDTKTKIVQATKALQVTKPVASRRTNRLSDLPKTAKPQRQAKRAVQSKPPVIGNVEQVKMREVNAIATSRTTTTATLWASVRAFSNALRTRLALIVALSLLCSVQAEQYAWRFDTDFPASGCEVYVDVDVPTYIDGEPVENEKIVLSAQNYMLQFTSDVPGHNFTNVMKCPGAQDTQVKIYTDTKQLPQRAVPLLKAKPKVSSVTSTTATSTTTTQKPSTPTSSSAATTAKPAGAAPSSSVFVDVPPGPGAPVTTGATTTARPATTEGFPVPDNLCDVYCNPDGCSEAASEFPYTETPMQHMKFRDAFYYVGSKYYVISGAVKSHNRLFAYQRCAGTTGVQCGALQPKDGWFVLCINNPELFNKRKRAAAAEGSYESYHAVGVPQRTKWERFIKRAEKVGPILIDWFVWSVFAWFAWKYFKIAGLVGVTIMRVIVLVSADCTRPINYGVIITSDSSHTSFNLPTNSCVSATVGNTPAVFTLKGVRMVSNLRLDEIVPLKYTFSHAKEMYCTDASDAKCPTCETPDVCVRRLVGMAHVGPFTGVFGGCVGTGDYYVCANTTLEPDPASQVDVWAYDDLALMAELDIDFRGTVQTFLIPQTSTIFEHVTLGRLQMSAELTVPTIGGRYVYAYNDLETSPPSPRACIAPFPITHYVSAPYKTAWNGPLLDQRTVVRWSSCNWDDCMPDVQTSKTAIFDDLVKNLTIQCADAILEEDSATALKKPHNITLQRMITLKLDFAGRIDGYDPANLCDPTMAKITSVSKTEKDDVNFLVVSYTPLMTIPYDCVLEVSKPPAGCAFSSTFIPVIAGTEPASVKTYMLTYSCYTAATYQHGDISLDLSAPNFFVSIYRQIYDVWTKSIGEVTTTSDPGNFLLNLFNGANNVLKWVWDNTLGRFGISWEIVKKIVISVAIGAIFWLLISPQAGIMAGIVSFVAATVAADPCVAVYCGLGTCVPAANTYKCQCPAGTTGAACEYATDISCQNGGVAMATHTTSQCVCPDGYEGDLCQYTRGSCTKLGDCAFDTDFGCYFAVGEVTSQWIPPDQCAQTRSDAIAATALDYSVITNWRDNQLTACAGASLWVGLAQQSCQPEPDCGWQWDIRGQKYDAFNIPWAEAYPGIPPRSANPDMAPNSRGIFAQFRQGITDDYVPTPTSTTKTRLMCQAGINRCSHPCVRGVCVGTRCICDTGYFGADCSSTAECFQGSVINGVCECLPGFSGPTCNQAVCPYSASGSYVHSKELYYTADQCEPFTPNDETEWDLVIDGAILPYYLIGSDTTSPRPADNVTRRWRPNYCGGKGPLLAKFGDCLKSTTATIKACVRAGSPLDPCVTTTTAKPTPCPIPLANAQCTGYSCPTCLLEACGTVYDLRNLTDAPIDGQSYSGPYQTGFIRNCTQQSYVKPVVTTKPDCSPYFSGDNCDIPKCALCINGQCSVVGDRPACVCEDGWRGEQCTIRDNAQCVHGKPLGNRCICDLPWYGTYCNQTGCVDCNGGVCQNGTCNCPIEHHSGPCQGTHACPYDLPLCLLRCRECPRSEPANHAYSSNDNCPYSTPLNNLCTRQNPVDQRCPYWFSAFCHITDNGYLNVQ